MTFSPPPPPAAPMWCQQHSITAATIGSEANIANGSEQAAFASNELSATVDDIRARFRRLNAEMTSISSVDGSAVRIVRRQKSKPLTKDRSIRTVVKTDIVSSDGGSKNVCTDEKTEREQQDFEQESSVVVRSRAVGRSKTFSVASDLRNTDDNQNLLLSTNAQNERQEAVHEQLKRRAIILELYEAEKSYVESLSALVMKYYLPLKEKRLINLENLNDIFYKIPEIHVHHQLFLFSYKKKIERWNDKETVGDIMQNVFAKSSLLETYTGFIANFPRSQDVLRTCKSMPAFSKFIEQQAKDNERKLNIFDLLIQPVQRIPRYELFLKDLIKHTAPTHPDSQLLRKALETVHGLAISIDEAKEASASSEHEISLDEVMASVELEPNEDVSYSRTAKVRFSINGEKRKDGNLFIIGRFLILTSKKRKTGLLSRKPSFHDRLPESCDVQFGKREHCLRMKERVEDVQYEVMDAIAYQSLLAKYHCISDNAILQQVEELLLRLNNPSQDLLDEVRKVIDRNEAVVKGGAKSEAIREAIVRLDLTVRSTSKICLWFSSPEERLAWLKAISEMKNLGVPDQKPMRSIDAGSVGALPLLFINNR